MPTDIQCYVCNSLAQEKFTGAIKGRPLNTVICPRCGNYQIFDDDMLDDLRSKERTQQLHFSSWLRDQGDIMVDSKLVDQMLPITPPAIHEKALKFLHWFSTIYPSGHYFEVLDSSQIDHILAWQFEETNRTIGLEVVKRCLSMLAETWIIDGPEYDLVFHDYAVRELGWFQGSGSGKNFKVSPKGFIQIEKERSNPDIEEKIFIAMYFHSKMNLIHNIIANAVMDAGYKPIRVDTEHPEGTIDDAIISGIRRSKGIVADFTERRGGVYFEAGFALGLDRLVVYTCKDQKTDKDNLHFDVEHRPFIFGKNTTKGRFDLKRKITDRIVARLGEGHHSFIETERSRYLLPEA